MMKKLRNWLLAFTGFFLALAASAANAAPLQFCDASDAIARLAPKSQNLNPKVLELAIKAYNCALKYGYDVPPILTVIDYSLPSNYKRLWVINLNKKRVMFNTLVAHGQGSGNIVPTAFSNTPESHQSSIGLFLTAYSYQGHFGTALRLKGLEFGFNDKAFSRNTVMHGAWYVSEALARKMGRVGRSWGCPAVPLDKVKPIVNTIKDGSLVFAYSNEKKWLKKSQFLHCGI